MVLALKEVKEIYKGSTKIRPIPKPITTAWIYRNADLGLISLSSNWTDWITIADKNLGAENVWDYWKYYQWGNNYWFATTWSISTTSSYQNPSWYSPSTWSYSSFVKRANWMSTVVQWLWGMNWTVADRRWPCDEWYHVPLQQEMIDIHNLLVNTWGKPKTWATLNTYLKMPSSWLRQYSNSNVASQWSEWYYWCSDTYSLSYAKAFSFASSTTYPSNYYEYWYWFTIRPFKNVAVQPTEDRTKLN